MLKQEIWILGQLSSKGLGHPPRSDVKVLYSAGLFSCYGFVPASGCVVVQMLPSLFYVPSTFDSPFYQRFIDLDDGNCRNVLRNLQYFSSLILSVLLYAGCFACGCFNFLECLTSKENKMLHLVVEIPH